MMGAEGRFGILGFRQFSSLGVSGLRQFRVSGLRFLGSIFGSLLDAFLRRFIPRGIGVRNYIQPIV